MTAKDRIEREAARQYERKLHDVLADLLPVVDNLERALDCGERRDDPVVEGVRLVHKQFLDRLAQHGVEKITASSLGRFNPDFHEAVAVVRVRDAALHGLVVDVLRDGYTVNGRLLRPARVRVARVLD